jgi:hypothetical protein
MSKVDQQNIFAGNVARLILWTQDQGYQVTLGEAHRPPITAEAYAAQGIGIKNSLHCDRLAIDLMLFENGEYLTDTKDYARVGNAWMALHEDNRWGGTFKRQDGNHFSMSVGDNRA